MKSRACWANRNGALTVAGRIAAAILAVICLGHADAAYADAYCNIVSVTHEQLNNAVRVKIEADGVLSPDVWRWYGSGMPEGDYYIDWEEVKTQDNPDASWSAECYPRVNRILFHLDDALPQVGSVAHVGCYPVSHVELAMTPEQNGRFGLDVAVVLHKRMRLRKFRFKDWSMFDAYLWDHHDPAWFEVVQSPDQRSLIITVANDRLPEIADHRKLEDVPEEQRELQVSFENGLLDVHARSVGLSELVEAVAQASGAQMMVETAAERVVTAELPHATVEEFAERIAECYGLVLNGSRERRVFTDIVAHTTSAYTSGETDHIPVRWLRAEKARGLLPNFLLDYVRVDDQRNALVLSGSKALADKVRSDLAVVDQPATTVLLHAIVLESSSTKDLAHELALDYSNDDLGVSLDAATGALTYSNVGVLGSEFNARLQALAAEEKVKIVTDSSITTVSGETGEVFAGVDTYVPLYRRLYDRYPTVEPVSAGVKLAATPWTGGGTVTMKVLAEVTSVGEMDPSTNLPVINTRSAEGTFVVRPGETVAIGGLAQTQHETSIRKVPILGDLPLIGKLFRKKIRRRTQSEFTVLLTPTIVECIAQAGGPAAPKEVETDDDSYAQHAQTIGGSDLGDPDDGARVERMPRDHLRHD